MSHTELFSSLLSLEQPLLTSLSSPPSSKSKSTSSSKSKSCRSKKSSSSIASDSDDSTTERKRPTPMQQRKRKYQDDVAIDGDTPLNKKLRRQQQNRQAAHTSRIKKKAQMEALQQQVNDLIEANRVLQAKVMSLTSEISTNRQILASTSPITIMESPMSQASSNEPTSPESPISPIPHAHIQTPLSDSESSMETSSVNESIISPPLVMSSLSIPSTTIPSSAPVVDVIPSSPRCSDSAVPTNGTCNHIQQQQQTTTITSFDISTIHDLDVYPSHDTWMDTELSQINLPISSSTNEHASFEPFSLLDLPTYSSSLFDSTD